MILLELPKKGIINLLKKFGQDLKSQVILLSKYNGWYSVSDEAYYDEEIIDENGVKKSKSSGSKVEWVEEESYF